METDVLCSLYLGGGSFKKQHFIWHYTFTASFYRNDCTLSVSSWGELSLKAFLRLYQEESQDLNMRLLDTTLYLCRLRKRETGRCNTFRLPVGHQCWHLTPWTWPILHGYTLHSKREEETQSVMCYCLILLFKNYHNRLFHILLTHIWNNNFFLIWGWL